MAYSSKYFAETARIASEIDHDMVERIVAGLAEMRRRGGRLFLIGVGGSAANCSHAVNDFRKLCDIEAYSPVDNVAELTARTNDEGWATVFSAWLATSRANNKDVLFVMSVGGGDAERGISTNIVAAIDEAKRRRMKVFGIVGRIDGHAARVGDEVVVIPTVDDQRITPHTEGFQAVVWHCLVSHPDLQTYGTKWESVSP